MPRGQPPGRLAPPSSLRFALSGMSTSYANVVNAFSTREEFTLLFGTNQTWSLGLGKTVDIKLSNRLVMNPLVAKRLHVLMGLQQNPDQQDLDGNMIGDSCSLIDPVSGGVSRDSDVDGVPDSIDNCLWTYLPISSDRNFIGP